MKSSAAFATDDKNKPTNTKPFFFVAAVVLAWITCSSVTQVANKKVLKAGTPPLLLVFCQMLFGTIVYRTGLLKSSSAASGYARVPKSEQDPPISQTAENWVRLVGICNVLGHTLTMWSMLLVAPALTHIVRSIEPLLMSLLSYWILNRSTSPLQMLSMLPMIIGIIVIATGGKSDNFIESNTLLEGLSVALLANIAMSLRNCGTKKYSILTQQRLDYPQVCSISLKYIFVPSIAQVLFDSSFTGTWQLLIASSFHVGYSSMSFYVLSLTDPLTHSIIKFVSRAVAVISLGIVFGVQLNHQMLIGVFLCVTGALLYTISLQKQLSKGVWYALALMILCIVSIWSRVDTPSTSPITAAVPLNNYQQEALNEVGLSDITASFKYPVLPIGGYRSCLDKIYPSYVKNYRTTVYMGESADLCPGCVQV